MPDGPLRIGRLAELAGVSRRTVDFYTRLGLISPAAHTQGNFRLYPAEAVSRIRFIRLLEQHGLALGEIASALRGPPPEDPAGSLERVDSELSALRKALVATPAVHGGEEAGLLSFVAQRIEGLLQIALEIVG